MPGGNLGRRRPSPAVGSPGKAPGTRASSEDYQSALQADDRRLGKGAAAKPKARKSSVPSWYDALQPTDVESVGEQTNMRLADLRRRRRSQGVMKTATVLG